MSEKDFLNVSIYDSKTFKQGLKKAKIEIINVNYDNYDFEGTEGILAVLKKKVDTLSFETKNKESTSKFAQSFIKVKIDETIDADDEFSKTTTKAPSQKEADQLRKDQFKSLYLLHKYQDVYQATDLDDVPQEIKDFRDNTHIALARLSGFNLHDKDGNERPCSLTERPINGPLSAYYSYISQLNLSLASESDFESSGKDYEPSLYINEHFLNSPIKFGKKDKFLLIVGMVAGIEYIHRLNKVHAHLNPTTVYLDENLLPKICGYGFIEPWDIDSVDDDKEEHDFGPLTNAAFVAPEVLSGKHIYQKSDVFSLGMMIYYILSGIEPFKNDRLQIQMKNVCEGTMPSFPECINDDWKKIILRCCELNPKTRFSSTELLSFLLNEERQNSLISSIPVLDSDSEISSIKSSDEYIQNLIHNFKFDGDFQDCYIMREMVPDPTALDEEVKSLINGATNNDPESLCAIAGLFLNGERNLPKEEGNAFELYKKASNLNYYDAIKMVAKLYREGIGTDKDLEKALKYNQKALNLIDDDKIEEDILNTRINEIEDEIKKAETAETTNNQNSNDNNLIKINEEDDEGNELRHRNKKYIEDHKIIIKNLSSTTTKADIEFIFRNYENISIELRDSALYSFASVCFDNEKDKKKFAKWYKKIKKIRIRNREVTIEGFPKTQKQIEKILEKKKIHFKRKPTNSTESKSIDINRNFMINFDDYYPGKDREKYQRIGGGTFGDAYEVFRKSDDKLFIAKVYHDSFRNAQDRKNFIRETKAMIDVDYPLIIKLIGFSYNSIVSPTQKVATILMEYAPNKTLEDVIKLEHDNDAPKWWNNTTKLKTIIGIAKAMARIHGKEYIHRDLKPENIFFDQNYEIKIGDFGCSRKYDNKNEVVMTFGVGSPAYTAPELFDEDNIRYSWEVDVYSFSIILYQLLTSKTAKEIYPKLGLYKFHKEIVEKGVRPQIPKGLNPELQELMEKCWSNAIDDRPSFKFIYDVIKKTFETDSPPTTFFPNVDVKVIRQYIERLDSLDN